MVHAQNIYRVAERAFGRGLKPAEIDAVRDLEQDYTEDVWRYAFREAVELGKVSIRYIQAVCRRAATEGTDDNRTSNGTSASNRPAAYDPGSYPAITIDLGEPRLD